MKKTSPVEHSIDDYLKIKSYKKIKTNMETDWDPKVVLVVSIMKTRVKPAQRSVINDSGLT